MYNVNVIGRIFQATYLIDLIMLSMFVFEMFVLQLGIMCYIIPFIYYLYIISKSIIIIRSVNISKISKYIIVGCSFVVRILRMYKRQWRHFLFGLIKASFDLYTSWVIRRCHLQFGIANECIRRLKRFYIESNRFEDINGCTHKKTKKGKKNISGWNFLILFAKKHLNKQ